MRLELQLGIILVSPASKVYLSFQKTPFICLTLKTPKEELRSVIMPNSFTAGSIFLAWRINQKITRVSRKGTSLRVDETGRLTVPSLSTVNTPPIPSEIVNSHDQESSTSDANPLDGRSSTYIDDLDTSILLNDLENVLNIAIKNSSVSHSGPYSGGKFAVSVMCFRGPETPGILAEDNVTAALPILGAAIRKLLFEAGRRQVRTVEEFALGEFRVLMALYPGRFGPGRCE